MMKVKNVLEKKEYKSFIIVAYDNNEDKKATYKIAAKNIEDAIDFFKKNWENHLINAIYYDSPIFIADNDQNQEILNLLQ